MAKKGTPKPKAKEVRIMWQIGICEDETGVDWHWGAGLTPAEAVATLQDYLRGQSKTVEARLAALESVNV